MPTPSFIIDLSKYNEENDFNTDMIQDLTVPCGSVDVQYASGAPQAPVGCASTKYSGDSINLQASPNGAIGPYHVRFWRKPNSAGVMTWGEVNTVRTISEGNSATDSIVLNDLDVASAVGHSGALTPDSDAAGNISESGAAAALAAGKIRVATTVYDSCPITPQVCLSYCDVSLGCVAPTCNFTVI